MSDRLYLSCILEGFTPANMLRHLEKALELFPFSKLAKRGPVLRVYAVEHAEPPAVEREFEPGTPPADIITIAREFTKPDCCVEIDAAWDLWQFDMEWKLAPASVTLSCFGPEFDNDGEDHIRLDLGLDSHFLPEARIEGSLRMRQSNLKSLLHLIAEYERGLSLASRKLWSESGANFAGILAETIGRFGVN